MPRKYDEDLFKDTTMTFGEHLEELRVALFKTLIALTIGFVIGLIYGTYVVNFVEVPVKAALRRYVISQTDKKVSKLLEELQAEGQSVPSTEQIREYLAQGYLPQPYLLDPIDTLSRMNRTLPQLGAAAALPSEMRREHLSNLSALCAAMSADAKAKKVTPLARIWELLPAVTQGAAEQIAQKPDALSQTETVKVAEEISNVISRADFYRDKDFSGLTEEVKEIVARKSELTPAGFHRELLARAYPELVANFVPPKSLTTVFLWSRVEDHPSLRLGALSAQEPFMVYLKASLVFGIVLAAPVAFFFLWQFVGAGLFPHEKWYVYAFMPVSILLFFAGVSLAFFFVLQFVLDYLLLFNEMMGLEPDIRISEWMTFALILPLGFGIAFQLPLVMLFLERINVFTVEHYKSNWRMSVLVIFAISMVLTPAEPYSMVAMAIPLCGLYYLGILMCRFFPRGEPLFD